MSVLFLLIGIFIAIIVWKLIKVTFKTVFWLIVIGIIAHFLIPGGLFLVGGVGFLIVGALITLIVINVIAFFFFES